jgi:cell division control protein 11
MRRKLNRFTVMAVGSKGSGRSSFLNGVLGKEVVTTKNTGEIDLYMVSIDDSNRSQKVTFIETPGFGKSINDEIIQNSILDYIKEQFDLYIEEESKIRRNPNYEDTRVHCVLYFISGIGNGLKQRDIVFLKQLCEIVNVIPILSKADVLTAEEVEKMRSLILDQISTYEINLLDLDNEDYIPSGKRSLNYNKKMPFPVISPSSLEDGNTSIRKHPAGVIDTEDKDVSSLCILRDILLNTHTEMMVDITSSVFYEKYRTEILESALNGDE